MAHTYVMLVSDTLCIRYSGLVTYGERSKVLPAAARRMRDGGHPNLLVDFSAAELIEENEGARRDYIAAAIAAPWPDRVRIASVALPPRFEKPLELASVVREFAVRAFESVEQAANWLASDVGYDGELGSTSHALGDNRHAPLA